jgi:hypothetical protein
LAQLRRAWSVTAFGRCTDAKPLSVVGCSVAHAAVEQAVDETCAFSWVSFCGLSVIACSDAP